MLIIGKDHLVSDCCLQEGGQLIPQGTFAMPGTSPGELRYRVRPGQRAVCAPEMPGVSPLDKELPGPECQWCRGGETRV